MNEGDLRAFRTFLVLSVACNPIKGYSNGQRTADRLVAAINHCLRCCCVAASATAADDGLSDWLFKAIDTHTWPFSTSVRCCLVLLLLLHLNHHLVLVLLTISVLISRYMYIHIVVIVNWFVCCDLQKSNHQISPSLNHPSSHGELSRHNGSTTISCSCPSFP